MTQPDPWLTWLFTDKEQAQLLALWREVAARAEHRAEAARREDRAVPDGLSDGEEA